jgi:hypothetical protein
MDNHPAIQFQSTWKSNSSDRSAFSDFWPAYQEDLLSMRKENSLDDRAIIFASLSDATFFRRFGAIKQPRVHPGPPQGTRVEVAANAISLSAFMLQQALIEAARKHLLKQVPSHLFEASKDAYGSLNARSLEFLCTSLIDQVGTLSKTDIKAIYDRLKTPYLPGEHIEAFVAVRKDLFRQLAQAGEPLPPSLKNAFITECMNGPIDFTMCWVTYAKDFPAVAEQTVERLFAAIINHVNIVLPLTATRVDLHINSAVIQNQALLDELKDIRSQLVALQATKVVPTKGRSFTDGPTAPFCWTHGPCWHRGDAPCTRPAPGHKPAATWSNQLSSPWKVLWRSQGRRTE